MSELGAKRRLFTALIVKLLSKMLDAGYSPCIGKDGLKHMAGSLHFEGLAMDIDLFDNEGKYLDRTEDHTSFGVYWKNLHPDCRWGGDFKKKDGNHYSVVYQGRA